MSTTGSSRLGSTPPQSPVDEQAVATPAQVFDIARARRSQTTPRLAHVRPTHPQRTTWSPVRAAAASGHHARTTPTAARRPESQTAFVVQRAFAITVRGPSLANAQTLAQAIERVLPALLAPSRQRCHIEATVRGEEIPTVVIDCPGADPQTLDTLMRSLESIAGVALRARLVLIDGARAHVRTWVGAWLEPFGHGPADRPGPPHGGPRISPAAA